MDERQLKELLSGGDTPAPTDAARELAIEGTAVGR